MKIINTAFFLLVISYSALCSELYKDAVLRINFAGKKVKDLNNPACQFKAKDIAFTDIPAVKMPNSNGIGAIFNGKSSLIDLKGKLGLESS